jgi:hypothetical protein
MDQQADRIERRLNIDFVMSVCALLISAVACATALYQLRNASLMMSAQTWPYVAAGWHYDNGEAGILVTNDGQDLRSSMRQSWRLTAGPSTTSSARCITSSTARRAFRRSTRSCTAS